jgi:rRNA maturation RNase YbeY
MKKISLRNQQSDQRINSRLLRQITAWVLDEPLALQSYSLSIALVNAGKMAQVNGQFLAHEGSTDIITFDYNEGYEFADQSLQINGDLYISIPDAVRQAEEFKTLWQEELARYVIHGVLHLLGFDDLIPAKRKIMKAEENRLLKLARRKFDLAGLSRS